MILRRVIEHVKAHNWFAVGIDFLIVVVGVFIGIQVSNLNAALVEAAKADSYLQRLHQDVSDDIVMLEHSIPPDIHAHLLVCHEVEPPHRHILTDCPAPAGQIGLVELANSLIGDERLRGDLVYAVSVMNTSTYIVDGVILVAATELRDRIEEALSSPMDASR